MGDFPYSFNSPVSGNKVLDNALAVNFRAAADEDIDPSAGTSNIPPVGVIMAWGNTTPPTGWLICDGSVYDEELYPDLYAVIGTTFGGTATSPKLPNLLGRTIVGAGSAGVGGGASGSGAISGGTALTARALGAWTGAETVVLATANLPAHNHPVTDPGHAHNAQRQDEVHNFSGTTSWAAGAGAQAAAATSRAYEHNHTFSGTTTGVAGWGGWHGTNTGISVHAGVTGITVGNTGSGTAHSNVQPQLALVWIIKAAKVATTGVSTAVDSSDPRLSDSRTPTGAAGGDLTGSYPSPLIADGVIDNANISATAGILLSKLAVDPLARANHTGTQLAATISDFNAAVLAAQSRVAVQSAGVAVGTRDTINFASGDDYIEVVVADSVVNDRVNVTVSLSPAGVTAFGSPNLDGGEAGSIYGGISPIEGGGV